MRRLRRECRAQILRIGRTRVRIAHQARSTGCAGAARDGERAQCARLRDVWRCAVAGRAGRRDHLSGRLARACNQKRDPCGRPVSPKPSQRRHCGGVRGGEDPRVKRPFAELWGTGSYAPPRVMKNEEFSKFLDTSDQWIQERTGIKERRVSSKDETNACMGKAAALQVLEQTGLTPLDIDAIVYATASPDRLLPSQACDLQAILGAKNAAAFDVGAACSGFVYALSTAEGMIAAEQAEHVLVIAAEKLTSIMDWSDRTPAVLFGGGAGATILRRSPNGRGIPSSSLQADGALAARLVRPGGRAA